MTKHRGRRDRAVIARRGSAGLLWCTLVAVTTLSGCHGSDKELPEVFAVASTAPVQDSMSMLHTMAGWAGASDCSHVSVEVSRGAAALRSIDSKNALVVQDNGSVDFHFEAKSEAEGKELFGFFAQVALHGVDEAEQASCVDVARSPS